MSKRSADGLFKRGNFWWGWRRLSLGGPLVRCSSRCRDRKAARLVKAEWERLAADPIHYASHKATLDDGIDMFLRDGKNRGLAAPTIKMYEQKCAQIARVLGGTRPLRSIVATTWDGYIATREEEGAHPHTVKKELIRGGGILKLAKRKGLYPHDLSSVIPRYSPRYVPRTRVLDLDELQRLGRALRADRLRHVAFVVATGARLSESYRAKPEHLSTPGFIFLDGKKTRKARRTIPIAPPLAPWIEFARPGIPFPLWHSANRDIKLACAKAGIAPATWNDLRRSNATLLKHAGMSSADVGELLGHVDGRMVEQVYGQSTPKSLQLAMKSAFDGTETTHPSPEPRELTPGERGKHSVPEGLLSRRSAVRIGPGVPLNRENEPFGLDEPSTESSNTVALRYKHDTPTSSPSERVPLATCEPGKDLTPAESSERRHSLLAAADSSAGVPIRLPDAESALSSPDTPALSGQEAPALSPLLLQRAMHEVLGRQQARGRP